MSLTRLAAQAIFDFFINLRERIRKMDDINGMLEFDKIRELLKEGASTERARERIDALVPILDQERAEAAIEETTEARKVLDSLGTPPSGSTQEVREIA